MIHIASLHQCRIRVGSHLDILPMIVPIVVRMLVLQVRGKHWLCPIVVEYGRRGWPQRRKTLWGATVAKHNGRHQDGRYGHDTKHTEPSTDPKLPFLFFGRFFILKDYRLIDRKQESCRRISVGLRVLRIHVLVIIDIVVTCSVRLCGNCCCCCV